MLAKIDKYFSRHTRYNSFIHFLAGVGIGVLIVRPFITHPVRVGLILILVSVFGHLYALKAGK